MSHEDAAPRVVLKHNKACVREICPLCHREHEDAGVPNWFFVEGRALCQGCAEEQATELFDVLTRSEVAQRLGYRGSPHQKTDK
jgi:hypothetical protein